MIAGLGVEIRSRSQGIPVRTGSEVLLEQTCLASVAKGSKRLFLPSLYIQWTSAEEVCSCQRLGRPRHSLAAGTGDGRSIAVFP